MLVSDIIKSVRGKINQPEEGGRFDDTDFIDYINNCLLELSDDLRSHRLTIQIPGNGTNVYPLPSDLLRIEQVTQSGYDVTPLPLQYMELNQNLESAGSGTGYCVRGREIVFTWNIADGNNVALHYRARVPYIESTEANLQVDEAWKMCIVYRVVQNCWEAMSNFDRANYYKNEYNIERADRRKQLASLQTPMPTIPLRPKVS